MTSAGKNKKKDQDVKIGKKYSIRSKVLKEERPYWVYLPNSYNTRDKIRRYPVLYLLDGNSHFQSVTGVVDFMSGASGSSQIPELIVIAIPNTNRMRDLAPTHTTTGYFGEKDDSLEPSGGGDAFLEFIQDELFPQIDSKFHTSPIRILVGHSLGGLLAIYALLHQPDMFYGYVALDPSLWFDNEILTQQAASELKQIRKLRKTLYISSANTPELRKSRRNKMRSAIRKFVKTLGTAQTEDFRLAFQYFNTEDHASVPLLSLYHGLLHIFEGFKPVGSEGLSALKARFKHLSKRMGGTLLPPEGYVNNMGYAMLYLRKDVKKAIAFFKYNTDNFPRSANAYDSLGEAYMVRGDKAQAIENYKKSLKLDPNNQNAIRRLQTLQEKKQTTDA